MKEEGVFIRPGSLHWTQIMQFIIHRDFLYCVLFTELCKRSAMGSGFNRSNLETPDPASYWSLNEICKYGGNGTTLLMFDTGNIHESHPSFARAIYRKIKAWPY